MKVYLDNAASTKVDENIVDAILPYFTDEYANPSSVHTMGNYAEFAIERAKEKIAEKLNILSEEIYFTSGATESNNWAIIRAFELYQNKGKHIIVSKIEHDSILNVCRYLQNERGAEITYIDVDEDGIVDIEQIKNSIRSDTIIVSIMYVNNEIGTIQPIEKIANILDEKQIFFHVDAVQAINKFPVDITGLKVSTLAISGHKLHAPKGIGILYINRNIKFKSFIHGGGQQRNRRSGTENVTGIIGIGEAIYNYKEEISNRIRSNRDYFISKLMEIDGVKLNGSIGNRVCNNINISIEGCDTEDIILGMDMKGVFISGGSACESGAVEPSHVLKALGLKYTEIVSSVRITISKYTTIDEIDYAINALKEVVNNIRQVME